MLKYSREEYGSAFKTMRAFTNKILLWLLVFRLLIACIPHSELHAQNHHVAIHDILKMKGDSSKIDSIISYTSSHRKDSTMEPLFAEGLKIARTEKLQGQEARLLDAYGVYKRDISDYANALQFHKEALEIAKSIKNKNIEMYALNNIGVVFRRLDQNAEALNHHMAALKIAESTGDDFSASVSLNSIGNIHIALANYKDAIRYFRKCLPIAFSANNNLGIAMNLANIGEAYEHMDQLDSAKRYYQKSLDYNRRITNSKGIAICYSLLGRIAQKQGNYNMAKQYLSESLSINKSLGDNIYTAQNYNYLGELNILLQQPDKAEAMYTEALTLARTVQSKTEMKAAYEGLQKVSRQRGDFEKALAYSELVNQYSDSIHKENNHRHVKQVEMLYQSETEQARIKLLETTRKNDRNLMIVSLIVFALLLMAGVLFYLRNRLIDRNKNLQRELEIRSQIASDLHDDMGSTLSSIRIFSELLRKPDVKSDDLLTKIEENAKDTMEALDDIIWLVKPSNDRFSNLSLHISQYAIPLFEGKGIRFTIDFPESITDAPLPMETRRNIFLIIKESINNLVKYSQCTEALVKAEQTGDEILFTVKDNGKGFDPAIGTDRNGVKNLHARANQIQANLDIKSTPGKGTEISLLVNLKEMVAV